MSPKEHIWRLTDLLMVGHGGALLVIFNARANASLVGSEINYVAWAFATGLVAAFLMQYLAYRLDLEVVSPQLQLSSNASDSNNRQRIRAMWLTRYFVVSCSTFVLGLVVAIGQLSETTSPASEPAETSAQPSPSTAVGESESPP